MIAFLKNRLGNKKPSQTVKCNAYKKQSAFTLLEVMAALAVFAVSSAGLFSINQQTIFSATRLENKTFAHWVALNTYNQIDATLSHSGLLPGNETSNQEMAGARWKVETLVEETPVTRVSKITITVKSEDGQQFANLITYLSPKKVDTGS